MQILTSNILFCSSYIIEYVSESKMSLKIRIKRSNLKPFILFNKSQRCLTEAWSKFGLFIISINTSFMEYRIHTQITWWLNNVSTLCQLKIKSHKSLHQLFTEFNIHNYDSVSTVLYYTYGTIHFNRKNYVLLLAFQHIHQYIRKCNKLFHFELSEFLAHTRFLVVL